ncbi:MAG TPA: hypothetical protein PKH16_06460 [Aequorivita sp.]|jgi:hypothetical protein|nr:hypothetical protein [Aequorivita sp.]
MFELSQCTKRVHWEASSESLTENRKTVIGNAQKITIINKQDIANRRN